MNLAENVLLFRSSIFSMPEFSAHCRFCCCHHRWRCCRHRRKSNVNELLIVWCFNFFLSQFIVEKEKKKRSNRKIDRRSLIKYSQKWRKENKSEKKKMSKDYRSNLSLDSQKMSESRMNRLFIIINYNLLKSYESVAASVDYWCLLWWSFSIIFFHLRFSFVFPSII